MFYKAVFAGVCTLVSSGDSNVREVIGGRCTSWCKKSPLSNIISVMRLQHNSNATGGKY